MRIHHQLLVLVTLVLSACASSGSEERRSWTVGSDLANPPFAWVDEAGVPQGRDVEMAKLLAYSMDVDLEWSRMDFADLLDVLERGEIDAVIATLGATPERAERVLLSEPYFLTSLLVVVRRGDGEPTSLAELGGRVVSAGIGTTSERALRAELPDAIAAPPSEKGDSSIDRLLAGEVDALIMDGPDALDFAREYPDRLAVIEEALATENYVIAIRPDGAEWLRRINGALGELSVSGNAKRLDDEFGLVSDAQ